MKNKILNHPRNEKISFNKDEHTYEYCEDRKFKGVTSWISEYTSPFDKEKVAKKVAFFRKTTPEAIIAEWDAAREYGDYVHENVETYVNDGLEMNVPELELFKQKIDELNLTPITSEWVVYDEDIERASAIDVVCVNEEGECVIIDIKTREKEIDYTGYKDKMMKGVLSDVPESKYHQYGLQVNIYKYWLDNKYEGIKTASVNYIFRLRNDVCEVIPVLSMRDKVIEMYNEKIES